MRTKAPQPYRYRAPQPVWIGARTGPPLGPLSGSDYGISPAKLVDDLFCRHHQRVTLVGRHAFGFGEAQFLAYHVGAKHERNHFVEGVPAALSLAAHAAVG